MPPSEFGRPSATPSLERHADPQSPLPDNSAALSRRAVEHLEPVGQLDEFLQLQTGPAGGVVDEDAFDDRGLGIEEDLGDLGHPAFGPETCEQSRMLLHDRIIYFWLAILALVKPSSHAGRFRRVYPIGQF